MSGMRKIPAVFLDRDGVIIRERNFLYDPKSIELIPGAIEAIKNLRDDFKTVVVSNQSGIARGFFSEEDLIRFQGSLDKLLKASGAIISGWYYCPHGPDDGCECRKPLPGMILSAAEEMHIDLTESWMVGDKSSDIGAGKAAGLKTILVKTGYGGKESGATDIESDYVADDLFSAVDIIIKGKPDLSPKSD
jgi:D-glycero-D-manno-heptose 1,7-bisphosphate phosphatase